MRKFLPTLFAACAAAALFQTANAAVFSINNQSYTTEFNTGSGANHSLMVLDYGATEYAFGYSWSGTKSGYDMLTDITANSAGNMSFTQDLFELGADTDPLTPFVDTIQYLTHNPPNSYPDSWFGYFNADNGGDWQPAAFGAFGRPLQNNSADDWVFQDLPVDDVLFNPQLLPSLLVAVPEPASLSLLAAGTLMLAARRRR